MLTRLFLLAASAAVPALAQGPPPAGGCTTNSFAFPSWFIQDLRSSSGASGNTTFHLVNRATNYTADLACQVGGSGWKTCAIQGKSGQNDTLQASIQVNGTTAQILVNQTWTCDDRGKDHILKFIAVGNNSATLSCTGQTCESAESLVLVRGSLLSPVAITPAYASGPVGHNAMGCTTAAQNPYWTASTIYYVDQRGEGEGSVSSQTFMLHLTNPSIGYEAGCIGFSSAEERNPKPSLTRLQCSGTEFQAQSADRYHIETSGLWDPNTRRFSVNQTWYCDETDPEKPLRIKAMGSEILPLTCTTVHEEGAAPGNKTSCVNEADITMNGELVSKEALPPYSIESPVASADGCTISSILNPKWSFSHFEVDYNSSSSGANNTGSPNVSFNLILQTANRGFQFPISIYQGTPVGNGPWYNCIVGAGGSTGQVLWPQVCTFQYNPSTKALALKADWICNDLDLDHSVLFSGTTTTVVNSSLACETVDGVSQCLTSDTAYSWVADITNVTWRATSQRVVPVSYTE